MPQSGKRQAHYEELTSAEHVRGPLDRLHFRFDRQLPVADQLLEQIAHYIAIGAIQPGEQLPTIVEFAERARVARGVLIALYGSLRDLGMSNNAPGRGTFISDSAPIAARRYLLTRRIDDLVSYAQELEIGIQGLVATFAARIEEHPRNEFLTVLS